MVVKIMLALAFYVGSASLSANHPIRDPFATLSNAPKAPVTQPLSRAPDSKTKSDLVLKAILWSDRPLANISGMIVAPGDRVHDFTVLQLSRKTAVLRRADESILLVLDEGN